MAGGARPRPRTGGIAAPGRGRPIERSRMEQAETTTDTPREAPVEPRFESRFEGRPDRDRDRDRRGGDDRRPESFEQMLRRFKKGVDNAGILKEVRARSFFESKSQKARRKAAKAARRRSRNKSRSGEQ